MRKYYNTKGEDFKVFTFSDLLRSDSQLESGISINHVDKIVYVDRYDLEVLEGEVLVVKGIRAYVVDERVTNLFNAVKPTTDYISEVRDFHEVFGHPVVRTPSIPDEDRMELRMKLLLEEVLETFQKDDSMNSTLIHNLMSEGEFTDDIVKVADGLADTMYVLSGAILEFGLSNKFKEIFDAVQESNMSKACDSRDSLEDTLKYYEDQSIQVEYHKSSEGTFIVTRKSDNKVLKSIHYKEVDIPKILLS